jgi:hypothetical protein
MCIIHIYQQKNFWVVVESQDAKRMLTLSQNA